jgi:hypothetical protein
MFRLQIDGRFSWPVRIVIIASVALLLATVTQAQSSQSPGVPPPDHAAASSGKTDSSDVNFGSPENEMRSKLLLKEEKKQYDENVARAREVSELGSQVQESFAAKKLFNSDDGKKLERLEKLTRKIRNEAGGSESDAEVKDLPREIDAAVKRLADVAGELYKLVEKTPRHVVSAAVIDQANKLIGLVQRLRNAGR